MKIQSDCLVIGGGLVGMMTALELVAAGLQVVLIEQDELGSGASGAGGGILSPLYPWREAQKIQELMTYSQHRYQTLIMQIEGDTGIDTEYICSGLLSLNIDENEIPAIESWQKKSGKKCEILKINDVPNWVPNITGAGEYLVWLEQVTQIRPPRLIEALGKYLQRIGVTVYEGKCALKIEPIDQQVKIKTATEEFIADKVVIANGAWSSRLLPKIAVKPVRGQMLCFNGKDNGLQQILLSDGKYLIPRKDGKILVGSTVEEAGYDNCVTVDARETLTDAAQSIFPAIKNMELIAQWSGLRPASNNNLPTISAYPDIPGVFINTGHHRNGILLAAGSAKLMVDLMLNNNLDMDLSPFSLEKVLLTAST